jgi:hypothetical protein
MSRTPLLFKESDVTRAVKAVRKAGLDIAQVKIGPDGQIVVTVKSDGGETDTANPWLAEIDKERH